MWLTGGKKWINSGYPIAVGAAKWWWLPGTLAALASAARFAYEIFRDHYIH